MKKTFDEILANIRREISTLREINNIQQKENARLSAENDKLRQEIAKLQGVPLNELNQPSPIEQLITRIQFSNPCYRQSLMFCNHTIIRICKQNDITTLSYFEGKKADELLPIKGWGKPAIAALYAICLHYGIDLHPSQELQDDKRFSDRLKCYQGFAEYPD